MHINLQDLFCRKLTIGCVYIYENDVSQNDEIGPLVVLQFKIFFVENKRTFINIFSGS